MKKIITCLIGIAFINNSPNADTLVYAGNIIDGISNQIQPNMTIHINGNTPINKGYPD